MAEIIPSAEDTHIQRWKGMAKPYCSFLSNKNLSSKLLYSTHQGLVNLNYDHMTHLSCKGNWDTESWTRLDSLGLQAEQTFGRQEGGCLGKVTAVGRACCVPERPDPELSGSHQATSPPASIPGLLWWPHQLSVWPPKQNKTKWWKPSKTENTHRSRFPRGVGAREVQNLFTPSLMARRSLNWALGASAIVPSFLPPHISH